MLLMQRNATVTIVHSRTKDAPSVVRNADIVMVAVGVPEMVNSDWIKVALTHISLTSCSPCHMRPAEITCARTVLQPGAVVIDVGINAKDDPTKKRGYRLGKSRGGIL